MKRTTAVAILAALVLVFLQSLAIADTTLEELLSGRLTPLTIKLGDLDGQWRRFNVGGESRSVYLDYMAVMAAREMGANLLAVYYTRGATYSISGETFLVAYQARPLLTGLADMMQSRDDSNPPVMTPESELTLSLVNLRTVGTMKDIRAVSLEEEIAESKALFGVDEYDENAPSEEIDQSVQNLQYMGRALEMYASAWGDKLPPMKNSEQVKSLLLPYAKQLRSGPDSQNIFTDPRTGDLYAVNIILSEHKLAHIQFPSSMAVYYEAVPREDETRAVLFLDGHIELVGPDEWAIIKRKSKIP